MSTTFQDIKGWLEQAKEKKATHLFVVLDKFSYENYPIFINEGEKVRDEWVKINNKGMQEVEEVYNMSMDIDEQLNQYRSFNW